MSIKHKEAIVNHFSQFISENKKKRFADISQKRTKKLVVVLEDIFQIHNISAVLRSCDCFGIQDVYIIEKRNKYRARESISRGAVNWLTLHFFSSTEACYETLKSRGYTIVATTPHENDMSISQVSITKPLALVFGTEETGLSEYALAQADLYAKIDMYGFTESFNISVSAAICMYETVKSLRNSGIDWKLDAEEIVDLQLDWLSKMTPYSKMIAELLASSCL